MVLRGEAEAARDESGGVIDMVSDPQILAAHRLLSTTESVFVEPGSAASIAGLLKIKGSEIQQRYAELIGEAHLPIAAFGGTVNDATIEEAACGSDESNYVVVASSPTSSASKSISLCLPIPAPRRRSCCLKRPHSW